MMISVRFSLNRSFLLLDWMQIRDDNCHQYFTKLIKSIEFLKHEISFPASRSNFWNLTHHSHYEFMNAKHFWGAAKTMNIKKMQQISILPFFNMFVRFPTRTPLRGDYEFFSTSHAIPRRMRRHKSFDIVNF